MTISSLFLAPCAVRADVAMPPQPPQEMVITGTLSWDGIPEKKLLRLTTKDDETIPLGRAEKIKETNAENIIDPEKYIGKKVAVTLIGKRPFQSPHLRFERMLRKEPPPPPPPLDVKQVISLTFAKK